MIDKLDIELNNIVKKYDKVVLDNVSLKINNESYISIVGESGAGKTTLLNVLSLIEDFDQGSYRFNDVFIQPGIDYFDIRRKNIGFIFQSYNLIPTLNCRENILLPGLYNKNIGYFDEIVESLGLCEILDKQIVYLSGGEKQRVGIARCLISNPSLIIADEPTGNLDAINTKKVLKLLESESKKGRAVVIVTHNEQIAKSTRKTYMLKKGKLYEDN